MCDRGGSTALVAEPAAEQDALAAFVGGIDEDEWPRPTRASGWDVRNQIATRRCAYGCAVLPSLRSRAVRAAATMPSAVIASSLAT